MGSVIGLNDNQVAEHQSGISRLCNSILCALCVAPVLMIGACVMLGWNEKRAVCDARAIAEGKDVVEQVGCASGQSGNGELVMFSCDLSPEGLAPLVPTNSDFDSTISFVGVGLRTVVEVYQCVETEHHETRKDSVGGGTTTVITYTYSTQWSGSYVDSSMFSSTGKSSSDFMVNCNAENPLWPSYLPTPGSQWNPSAKVGAFTIPQAFVERIALETTLPSALAPAGWTHTDMYYQTTIAGYESQSKGIGRVRVNFYGNDWSQPKYTVLGENSAGTIGRWTASDSWLCSGFTLGDIRLGTMSLDTLFAALESEANAVTFVLRFLGFFVLWFAFSRLFGPLEVAADCIPCIGRYLGDSIAAITCCLSCLPGCACALGIIGIVWVAMRPAVGIPLIIVFFCVFAGFVAFKIRGHQQKAAAGGREVAAAP